MFWYMWEDVYEYKWIEENFFLNLALIFEQGSLPERGGQLLS